MADFWRSDRDESLEQEERDRLSLRVTVTRRERRSLRHDDVPGAKQSPLAYVEEIDGRAPNRRRLLGLRFLRLLSNQGTPVIVSHGGG